MSDRSRPIDEFPSTFNGREPLSRREFLRVAASVGAMGAGAVLLGGCGADDGNASPTSTPGVAADPPPETTTIRLVKTFPTCPIPIHLAGLFLPEEGFTNVQYIEDTNSDHGAQQLAAGEIDIGLSVTSSLTTAADRGDALVLLAGIHPTCFDLFGGDRVQTLRDLKDKRIFVLSTDAHDPVYVFLATLLAHVGIDIENEVDFVVLSELDDAMAQLKAGTIDAMLCFPPISAKMRADNIGHLVLDGVMDPPWSQHFCCMATGNSDFVEQHPAATKRALRAILKATDLCAKEPERAARYLVDTGYTQVYVDTPFTQDYDSLLDTVKHMSYSAWREFNPEDTVRFYALRLKEAGLVSATPEALIARATDWRYLDEIKRELAVA
jgi:NitT/TauT family transport system substrate-binding protein